MKRARWWLMLLVVLFIGAGPMRADSSYPYIAGTVHMIELCPKSICGVALFTGIFWGQIGVNHTIGTVTVVVDHGPLPQPDDPCTYVSGLWEIRTLFRTIGGVAARADGLCADTALTFDVDVNMGITKGGSGALGFSGLLDHTPFPPTLNGDIFQLPPPQP